MSLTVGDLRVELDARMRAFDDGLRRAEARIGSFERTAGRSAAGVSSSFSGLGRAIAPIGGLLAGLGGSIALVSIAKSAIEASAAMEGYEVRLRALLGSQGAANEALETFVGLSSETPFALNQIVEGATTLASVSLGNRESLEELTQVAANLAAVTGLSFQDAAGNLQRALSAGIASADLFRTKGVTRLVESVAGIPDATKLSLEETRAAFVKVFGKGGDFGTAAKDLSLTLAGALSNIGDASLRLRTSLGDALSPTTVAIANEVIIPAFNALTEAIDGSSTSLAFWFADGAATFILQLGEATEEIAEFLSTMASVGLSVRNFGKVILILVDGFQVFFGAVENGFAAVKVGALSLLIALVKIEESLDTLDEGFKATEKQSTSYLQDRAAELQATMHRTSEAIQAAQAGGLKADAQLYEQQLKSLAKQRERVVAELTKRGASATPKGAEKFSDTLEREFDQALLASGKKSKEFADTVTENLVSINERMGEIFTKEGFGDDATVEFLRDVGTNAKASAERVRQLGAELASAQAARRSEKDDGSNPFARSGAPAVDAAAAQAQAKGLSEIEKMLGRIRREELERIDPLLAQIDQIDEQISKTNELALAKEDEAKREAALAVLTARRAELVERLNSANAGTVDLELQLEEVLAQATQLDADRAREIREAVAARREEATGAEGVNEAIRAGIEDAARFVEEEAGSSLGKRMGETIHYGIEDGLRAAMHGEGFGFAELLGSVTEDFMIQAFERSTVAAQTLFGDMLDGLVSGLGDSLASVFGEGGLAGFFGGKEAFGDLMSGVLGLGTGLLQASLRDAEVSSTAGSVRSAVSSTQAVRGVVAGPTQIAIAEVDRAIADAFVETNSILRRGNAILVGIERNTRGGGAPSEPAARILATESESLI